MSGTVASMTKVLKQQFLVALFLGTGLAAAGFLRVWLTGHSSIDAFAISSSLLFIVMTSVLLGSALPFGLQFAGVDPANAGTSI